MRDTSAETFAADTAVGTTVVMFHGATCGPCAGMKPVIARLTAELNLKLVGVDAATNRTLCGAHNVRAVPTVIAFRDGVELFAGRLVGGKTEEQLRAFLTAVQGVA